MDPIKNKLKRASRAALRWETFKVDEVRYVTSRRKIYTRTRTHLIAQGWAFTSHDLGNGIYAVTRTR